MMGGMDDPRRSGTLTGQVRIGGGRLPAVLTVEAQEREPYPPLKSWRIEATFPAERQAITGIALRGLAGARQHVPAAFEADDGGVWSGQVAVRDLDVDDEGAGSVLLLGIGEPQIISPAAG